MAPNEETTDQTPDQSAMLAIMQEQLRSQAAEIEALRETQVKRRKGPSVEEQRALWVSIRTRSWAKDKNNAPHLLTLNNIAMKHVELNKGTLMAISSRECAKIYGLEIADDGALLFDGKKVAGTSDEDFQKPANGGESIEQRVARLTARAAVLQQRWGMNCPMPDSNDWDSWEADIEKTENRIRNSTPNAQADAAMAG